MRRIPRAIAASALAALLTAGVSAAPATSFSGQATLVNASVPLLGKILSDLALTGHTPFDISHFALGHIYFKRFNQAG